MTHGDLDLRPVAALDDETRGDFVVRVYQHLMAAIVAFVGVEALFFATGVAEAIYDFLAPGGLRWLVLLGGFMVGQTMAANASADLLNPQRQYGALLGAVVLEALLFAPMLYLAFNVMEAGTTVAAAALLTAIGFAGLTVVAFVTRKDLSFMRPMLMFSGIVALVLIAGSLLFGFELGVWFSVAMIAFAGASILYQTQTIIRQYPSQAHVAAALALFMSVMMLFWYVLRLLLSLRD